MQVGTWNDLEDGIQCQFSDGVYHSGDYWLIPARTATAEVEWPPYAVPNSAPVPQPPLGIHHHYCRLALLDRDGSRDLARARLPADISAAYGAHRLPGRRLAASWRRTGITTPASAVETLLAETLVWLNGTPDQNAINNNSFVVVVELFSLRVGFHGGNLRDPIVWRGELEVRQSAPGEPGVSAAVWSPGEWATEERLAHLFGNEWRVRVLVTLKGRNIWHRTPEGQMYYLDGQVVGTPGMRDNRRAAHCPCISQWSKRLH